MPDYALTYISPLGLLVLFVLCPPAYFSDGFALHGAITCHDGRGYGWTAKTERRQLQMNEPLGE